VHPITVVEVEYSLATRVIEKELLRSCRELGVGVVAYGVMSRGLLTGALTGEFEPTDFRAYAPRFTGENFELNKKKMSLLKDLAEQKKCSPAQLSIAWVLHQGKDILPLIGTINKIRLKENLKALDIELLPEELNLLSETFPEGSFAGSRYAQPQMGIVVN
jgi:aryl-alcohol dehydrogenase-like predicted oxidoreductase